MDLLAGNIFFIVCTSKKIAAETLRTGKNILDQSGNYLGNIKINYQLKLSVARK